MKKQLVLAEKPSVARDIARVLKCTQKKNGYIEGPKYIVTWALGHLVTLAAPEQYKKEWKAWDLAQLPMLPNHLKTVVIKQSGKQFNIVKQQLHRQDVGSIVIATDAGREGELVARWIIEQARVKKPTQRLWISSVTDKAIREGFNQLKPAKQYEHLYQAAVARAEADWLVGLNATRALTTKYNAQLSCGRVQTPTLAMIAKREEEISQFKPRQYFGIQAEIRQQIFTWTDRQGKQSTFDEALVNQIMTEIKDQPAIIKDIKAQEKKQYAPGLFDLTELQQEAHHRFHYSAKETLSIAQKLYEQHKVLTYPRTDSKYLSQDIVSTLKERLQGLRTTPYHSFAQNIIKQGIKANGRFVNDNKVSDHHAIIPTEEVADLAVMSERERKLYLLVVERFLAVLMPAYRYQETKVTATIANHQFTAKYQQIIDLGYKALNKQTSTNTTIDAVLNAQYKVAQVLKTQGQTTPPSRFNEGTLIKAMENPIKFMQSSSNNMKQTLQETGGLGTVATRADIIEKLFNSFVIEKRQEAIYVTNKGKQLLSLSPQELRTPELTAQWEMQLSNIAQGKLSRTKFIKDITAYTQQIINEIKSSEDKFKHDNLTKKVCDKCGDYMLEVKTKDSTVLVCQNQQCRHRKTVVRLTKARCPQCKKRLSLYGQGDQALYSCVCGYREKQSQMNERLKKTKQSKVSRHDMKKYMKQDNSGQELSDKFAALKDLFK